MSPRIDRTSPCATRHRAVAVPRPRARLVAVLAACSACAAPPLSAAAQTIADYGRSQRLLLEATMTQNAARAAALQPPGSAASAPGPLPLVGSIPGSGGASVLPSASPRVPVRPPEPELRVRGVFVSSTRTLAEVLVDGAPYVLAAGQGVPGTPWRVASIAADRVVLDRPGARDDAHAAPVRRSFPLVSSR